MPNENEINAWSNFIETLSKSPFLIQLMFLAVVFAFVYFMARLIISVITESQLQRNLDSINSYMLEIKGLMGRVSVYLEKQED